LHNPIISGISQEVAKALAMNTFAEKFDAMFALTYALKQLDFWMHYNDMHGENEELENVIDLLGNTWKALLSNTNTELGIDEEYTRPGIESLLSQFAEDVKYCQNTIDEFNWK
jgi:hypothetical protein